MRDHRYLAQQSEIMDVVVNYWREVDARWGADAHMFFTEDGVFESDNMKLKGRAEIRSFYDWRRSRGERVARHIVNNALVTINHADHATISYIMTIYAADGVPVLPVASPNLISDVAEELVRNGDGWLIIRKVFTTLFKGEVPATVMPADILDAKRHAKSGTAR